MANILIIEKLGNVKGVILKTEDDIYKRAGLKTSEGFKCYTNWPVEIGTKKYNISLYGKTTGRANSENKYEFPPPVDSVLFFGSCALVNRNESGKIIDLSKSEWDTIYETLYGGFDDVDDDSYESDEDDDPNVKRTKDGYVKDGFIVDEEDDEEDEEEDDDDEEYVKKTIKKTVSKKSTKISSVFELKPIEVENNYLDCTSELSEESYIE